MAKDPSRLHHPHPHANDNEVHGISLAAHAQHVTRAHVGPQSLPSPVAIKASSKAPSPASTASQTHAPGNVSFSQLPPTRFERALSETNTSRQAHEHPAQRSHAHEFMPRSLAHVLDLAETQGSSFRERRPENAVQSTQEPLTLGAPWPEPRGRFLGREARAGSSSGSGLGSGGLGHFGTSMPESRFSEFEVVYDDGVRKQRTFSLTTQFDDPSYEYEEDYANSRRK
ncbi:hypothetical protein BGZ94_008298 [Podila epigama]|nr:hypothetical protein BGZ94_008298 [Podila epigama]